MSSAPTTDESVVVIKESWGILDHNPRTDMWTTSMLHREPLRLGLQQPTGPGLPSDGQKMTIWIVPYEMRYDSKGNLLFSAYACESQEKMRHAVERMGIFNELPDNQHVHVQFVRGMATSSLHQGGRVEPDDNPSILQASTETN